MIYSGDWKAMLTGCQSGDLATVRYYLSRGIDPCFQHPEMGTTALHEAALYGHLEIVKLLVDHGADTQQIREFGGGTPLQVAKQAGQGEVAQWLKSQEPKKWWRFWS